jgi:hypothetical protein
MVNGKWLMQSVSRCPQLIIYHLPFTIDMQLFAERRRLRKVTQISNEMHP